MHKFDEFFIFRGHCMHCTGVERLIIWVRSFLDRLIGVCLGSHVKNIRKWSLILCLCWTDREQNETERYIQREIVSDMWVSLCVTYVGSSSLLPLYIAFKLSQRNVILATQKGSEKMSWRFLNSRKCFALVNHPYRVSTEIKWARDGKFWKLEINFLFIHRIL